MSSKVVIATLLIAVYCQSLLHAQSNASSSQPTATIRASESSASLEPDSVVDKHLVNKFRKKIYPLLTDREKGCVECHDSSGTSSLVFTGDSMDDFHRLFDEQYLKFKGADTLLNRVTTSHAERRMPKDAQPWSKKDVQRLRMFLHAVQDAEVKTGVAADEQFPRSLLGMYQGEKPVPPENQFLTYWQLRGKIKVLFDDDWIRADRDLFAENLAMFGGADFKTRFNESSQPTATFLTGLEMLARDVSNRAHEQQSGPFKDWPAFDHRPAKRQPIGEEYRSAIHRLYDRVLYRPASDREVDEAYALLCGVFELEEAIKQRDDELEFELIAKDNATGLEQREVVRIPVRGELLQVRQFLIDQAQELEIERPPEPARSPKRNSSANPTEQESAASQSAPKSPKSLRQQILGSSVRLEANVPNQRIVLHNVGTIRNVSFAGLEILDAHGHSVESIGLDSSKIEIEGAWQIADEDGYKSYEDRNQHKGSSSIRVAVDVRQSGEYQLALLWRANERNARRVLVELFAPEAGNVLACPTQPSIPPQGEAHFFYDCGNDSEAFARPMGRFQFSDQGSVDISNRGTLDTVTAGAVEFVDADSGDQMFLIDSLEADGNQKWQRFDEGRFKAYNVKGAKLHDENSNKGELNLTYRPSGKSSQGWTANNFYQLRVYYPGKRDQECQVPIVVRAKQSSPIVQVVYPSLAKADAKLRIDASASYTVAHGKLEFTWRQIAGTRVQLENAHAPAIEFKTPRRSVEQVAWTALCSALLRHPDFLFTRPPSLMSSSQPDVKQRLRLVKLSLDLLGRPPTTDELEQLARGTSLAEITDRFLDSDEFRKFYFHRIRLNLESQGTEIQDEPARLWSYIAFSDRPFQEILTAEYTVNNDMERMERPKVHGKTGLLTTPGFIQGKPGLPHYNYAAQVSMLFLGFVYEVPAEIVDQRVGVTALGTTDPNSVCYSCHKILTPLAFQRLNWTDAGEYRTQNEDGLPIDASDQNASEDYPFPGTGLEAFATQAVKKERFIRTIIDTHVNFYFGRPMRFREDERVLYKRLWDAVHRSDFKIRALIREIVNSPEYLMN